LLTVRKLDVKDYPPSDASGEYVSSSIEEPDRMSRWEISREQGIAAVELQR